jgi:hypothetical protein
MTVIQVRARVDERGNVLVPVGAGDAGLEVDVTIRPAERDKPLGEMSAAEREAFVQSFAGAWQGDPLVRPDQGEYETRDELK